MAVLQVRDVDDKLYDTLKFMAKQKRRSISQEVIKIIETYLANPTLQSMRTQTEAFLSLTGSWEGEESAEDMINGLRKNREESQRFGGDNGIFD